MQVRVMTDDTDLWIMLEDIMYGINVIMGHAELSNNN